MNKALLLPEVQDFIKSFNEEISKLAFRGSPWPEITIQELIQQIEGYQKSKIKLPTWYATNAIYYPPKLNIEQTSSEVTAKYKASLIDGETIADITGGFGVDSFYFSKNYKTVHHFERNKSLSSIVAHNFKQLGLKNVSFFAEDAISGLENKKYDVIYVDPSRRHDTKGKVFFLKDCEPNLIEHQESLLNRCNTLLVKTSPMLDINIGLEELQSVQEIHIVAIDNEVKELLWILQKGGNREVTIKTIHFNKKNREEFSFLFGNQSEMQYSTPLTYLYEPNAAIMKSGGFSNICDDYGLKKIAKHSHLFTSDKLISFPGRVFKIMDVIPYKKNTMKTLSNSKANVSTRNFPENVSQLKKKWKIKDGGQDYLFFTSLADDSKVVIKTTKTDFEK